ncbi:hypothetical protein KKF45_04285, partial [Patescibacteria group bacterium]|nr:hypothetical protein [Patescibacteria group bacterium]
NAQINYQGKLTDANDVAVEDEDYNITFRLYTSPTSATTTNIWEEERINADKVTITNGLFSVMLGEVMALPDNIFNQTLYLGVEIGGSGSPVWDGEMTPRKKLGTVPAAFEANRLDGIDSLSFLRSDDSDTMASTSASTLLTITQSGTGDILNLFDGATEVFTVLDGGNVGIGTTTPYTKFAVSGDTIIEGELTVSTLQATSSISAPYFTATDASATSTFAGGLNVASGGLLYNFSTGNVGIGTVSPTKPLHIQNSLEDYLIKAQSDDTRAGIVIEDSSGASFLFTDSGKLNFLAGGDGTGEGQLVIDSSSNKVGIGTASPNVLLTVGSSTPSQIVVGNKYNSAFISGDFEVAGTAYFNGATIFSGLSSFDNASSSQLTVSDYLWVGDDDTDNLDIRAGVWNLTSTATTTATMTNGLNFDSNTFVIDPNSNRVGIGTSTPYVSLTIDGTDGIMIPIGITGERPTGRTGIIRYNTTTSQFEGYADSSWGSLSGLIDVDQDTYISAETTAGADNDQLLFYTLGGQQMIVDSNGRIGIGTSTPYAKLSIAGTAGGTEPLFVISTSTSAFATSTALFIDSDGRVGIGTSSPDQMLDVAGKIKIGDDSTTPTIGTIRYDGGMNGSFDGWDGYNWVALDASGGDWTISGENIYRNLGNVGIGTTSPYSLFSVLDDNEDTALTFPQTINGQYGLQIESSTTTTGYAPTIVLVNRKTDGRAFSMSSWNGGEAGKFIIKDETADTDRLVIASNGYVGIGTTTPVAELSVNGDAYLTGGVGIGIATTTNGVLQTSGMG